MKFFLDCEFIEGFHKPLFGKRRHFIDLISIGIVSEDNKALYFISNEYNYNDADKWVKENVIYKAYEHAVHGDNKNKYSAKNFHKHFGTSTKEIVHEIMAFVAGYPPNTCNPDSVYYRIKTYPPEFYGYYSDYDWVLFCSLFGRMIDLPKGFPMYCKDLKQMFDNKINQSEIRSIGYDRAVERLKKKTGYPEQKNEHNSLADAAWNKELFNFLQTF